MAGGAFSAGGGVLRKHQNLKPFQQLKLHPPTIFSAVMNNSG